MKEQAQDLPTPPYHETLPSHNLQETGLCLSTPRSLQLLRIGRFLKVREMQGFTRPSETLLLSISSH